MLVEQLHSECRRASLNGDHRQDCMLAKIQLVDGDQAMQHEHLPVELLLVPAMAPTISAVWRTKNRVSPASTGSCSPMKICATKMTPRMFNTSSSVCRRCPRCQYTAPYDEGQHDGEDVAHGVVCVCKTDFHIRSALYREREHELLQEGVRQYVVLFLPEQQPACVEMFNVLGAHTSILMHLLPAQQQHVRGYSSVTRFG